LEWDGIVSAIKEGLNKINFSEILAGAGLTVGGGALSGAAIGKAFGVAMSGSILGAAIGGIVAGIPMFITGVYDAIVNGLNWLSATLIPLGATLTGAGVGAIIGMVGGPIGAALGAAIGLMLGLITDYTIWWFQNVPEWLNEHIIEPVKEKLINLYNWIDQHIIQPVIEFFAPIKESIDYVVGIAKVKIIEIKNSITGTVSVIWNKIVEIKNKIVEIFNALKWAFNEYIWKPIVNAVSSFYYKYIHPVVVALKSAFSAAWETFKKYVYDKIVAKFEALKTKLIALRDFIATAFKAIGTGVVNFVSNSFKNVINGVLSMAENAINRFIRMLNNAIVLINKIPGVNITKVTELSIPRLAEGGMVDTGQMFIAREAGPELVGSIGNKTAVANNDQIIAGIESGVYRAMVAANGNGGGSQTIRIINEIDGDVVGERVIKYHNGIVMQTGESPLLA
jgi:hypothetical protein